MVGLRRLDVDGRRSDLGLVDSLMHRVDSGWELSITLLQPTFLHVIVEDLTDKIARHVVGVDSIRDWWCHLIGVKGPLSWWHLLCLWGCEVSEMTYVIQSQIGDEAFDCLLSWLRLEVIGREGWDCSIGEVVLLIWCPIGLVVELAWSVVLVVVGAVWNDWVLILRLLGIRSRGHSLVLSWAWSLAIRRITVWNLFGSAW